MHEPLAISDLSGEWRRSLLAYEDGRSDTSSYVRWLQGPSLFCDIRQPEPMRKANAGCLRSLSTEGVLALAAQEGFAGQLVRRGRIFEWIRWLDFQPATSVEDCGTLAWQGDILVETGHHVAYIEHWHRDLGRPRLSYAFHLRDRSEGCAAILVVASNRFAFARARGRPIGAGQVLRDLVLNAPSLAAAQDLVDCEVSFGSLNGWAIDRSTLPWRLDTPLNLKREGMSIALDDVEPDGHACRRTFDVVDQEESNV